MPVVPVSTLWALVALSALDQLHSRAFAILASFLIDQLSIRQTTLDEGFDFSVPGKVIITLATLACIMLFIKVSK